MHRVRIFSLLLLTPQLTACAANSGVGRSPEIDPPEAIIVPKPIKFDERRRELSVQYLRDRHGLIQADATIVPKIVLVHWTNIPTLEETVAVFGPVELPTARSAIGSASTLNVPSQSPPLECAS